MRSTLFRATLLVLSSLIVSGCWNSSSSQTQSQASPTPSPKVVAKCSDTLSSELKTQPSTETQATGSASAQRRSPTAQSAELLIASTSAQPLKLKVPQKWESIQSGNYTYLYPLSKSSTQKRTISIDLRETQQKEVLSDTSLALFSDEVIESKKAQVSSFEATSVCQITLFDTPSIYVTWKQHHPIFKEQEGVLILLPQVKRSIQVELSSTADSLPDDVQSLRQLLNPTLQ